RSRRLTRSGKGGTARPRQSTGRYSAGSSRPRTRTAISTRGTHSAGSSWHPRRRLHLICGPKSWAAFNCVTQQRVRGPLDRGNPERSDGLRAGGGAGRRRATGGGGTGDPTGGEGNNRCRRVRGVRPAPALPGRL